MQHTSLKLRVLTVRQICIVWYFNCNRFIRVKSRYFNLIILFIKQITHLITHLQLFTSPHFECNISNLSIAETSVYFIMQLLCI